MSTTITMPQLGETVTEGTVAQWLKKVGDSIEKYESFVEVTTDKVNAEVPSPVSGVLTQIIAQEGETVPTGAPIAVIEEVGAVAAAQPATSPSGALASANAAAPSASPASPASPAAPAAPASPASPSVAPAGSNGHAGNGASRNGGTLNAPDVLRRVSPAVRRLAREHSVDLISVHGTGQNGRITANDVLASASQGPSAATATSILEAPLPASTQAPASTQPPAAARPATSSPRPSYSAPVPGETIPLSQARKIIAQRMLESKHNAPHAWTMVEVDVSGLWKWRNAEKERFARDHSYPLTLLPFFVYAAVQALKAYPLMNARFTDAGILVHREINVGLAVALDSNLIVPVIREAAQYSISGLAVAAGKLIERARSGKLGADDLSGGTFTVNNTGANGSIMSAPIINGGQAGIVTMEAVVKRPIVTKDDAIAIRSMMNVCLSLDHRVVDGSIASAFLVDLKKRLESMSPGGTL
jgi:2-oxoisovalerate dehydrogenase E2 component (dihydrolipoyl transacylase)